MPETLTPATDPAPADPTPNVVPPTQGDPADLGDAGKKALGAERTRADAAEKANKALQSKLDAIELANLSELEKAQKIASDATAKLTEYESTVVRQRVAIAKGIPAALVGRLHGATEEELSADADVLLGMVRDPNTPLPDPSQGAHGNPASGSDVATQFANFMKGQLTR